MLPHPIEIGIIFRRGSKGCLPKTSAFLQFIRLIPYIMTEGWMNVNFLLSIINNMPSLDLVAEPLSRWKVEKMIAILTRMRIRMMTKMMVMMMIMTGMLTWGGSKMPPPLCFIAFLIEDRSDQSTNLHFTFLRRNHFGQYDLYCHHDHPHCNNSHHDNNCHHDNNRHHCHHDNHCHHCDDNNRHHCHHDNDCHHHLQCHHCHRNSNHRCGSELTLFPISSKTAQVCHWRKCWILRMVDVKNVKLTLVEKCLISLVHAIGFSKDTYLQKYTRTHTHISHIHT